LPAFRFLAAAQAIRRLNAAVARGATPQPGAETLNAGAGRGGREAARDGEEEAEVPVRIAAAGLTPFRGPHYSGVESSGMVQLNHVGSYTTHMPISAIETWFPVLVQVTVAIAVAAALVGAGVLIGKRVKNRVKDEPYECGFTPVGSARGRFSVKYYLVAMLFILFDIEAIFLYPWAIVYRDLKLFAFLEMLLFIGLVMAGFFYIWKKGVLDWAVDDTAPDQLPQR
jgi:NADH-quinone oxidoreductase subunit A